MPAGLYAVNTNTTIDKMTCELLYVRFVAVDVGQDEIAQRQEGCTERKIDNDQREQHPAKRMVRYTIDLVVADTSRTPSNPQGLSDTIWFIWLTRH